MKAWDPNNLTGRQVILLVAPLASIVLPISVLLGFQEVQLVRVIFGGWNLMFWMAGTYIVVEHFCSKEFDKDKHSNVD